ncbi:MAG: hydroxyacylglutathione hydrolase [Aeromonas sp.]
MQVITICALETNYIWLIVQGQAAWVIDPGVAAPVLARLQALNLSLVGIAVTHHHHDHIGGVSGLLAVYPNAEVYGPAQDALPDLPCGRAWTRLNGGESLHWGALSVEVLALPGHTLGHIGYVLREANAPAALFAGDTLFSGGCGRLFEGSAEQLWTSLLRLRQLPADTQLYCAHEYTLSNLRFGLNVTPDNTAMQAALRQAQKLAQQGLPSVPSTLGHEKLCNVFLRADEQEVTFAVQKHGLTCGENALKTFTLLRRWKDEF